MTPDQIIFSVFQCLCVLGVAKFLTLEDEEMAPDQVPHRRESGLLGFMHTVLIFQGYSGEIKVFGRLV